MHFFSGYAIILWRFFIAYGLFYEWIWLSAKRKKT